ncbi:MAG: winged helix-turn-helix transcriptional regulator [Streptomycetaceae bacterium]|nr:winged helix-turn-helix transcriptional regulator [Streptomycetaceae bacterium]
MTTTGLPHTTRTDLPRVTDTLELLAPRWSVWVLMTLSAQPLRYTEIKPKLPWLTDGQLHPRLRKLTAAGLVERTAYTPRHVTYGLTDRGTALMPVLTVIAAWGEAHLEKDMVPHPATGKLEPERIPAAQNIEDALALITPRHATPLLWALQVQGTASATSLAAAAMPDRGIPSVYPPLRQLVDDGLVEVTHGGSHFQLSAYGRALAPVYRAISAWAAEDPSATADTHPVWGQTPAPPRTQPGPWITTPSRLPAPPAVAPAAPALSIQPPAAAWKTDDLFSHQIPAHPLALCSAGGPRR